MYVAFSFSMVCYMYIKTYFALRCCNRVDAPAPPPIILSPQ